QRQVRGATAGGDHAAVGQPQELVVRDHPAVGVVGGAGAQHDGAGTPLRVGQLHPVSGAERPAYRPRRPLRVAHRVVSPLCPPPRWSRACSSFATSAVRSTPTTWSSLVTRYSPAGAAWSTFSASAPRNPTGNARIAPRSRATASTLTHGRRDSGTAPAARDCTGATSLPEESATASADPGGADCSARRCASASGVPVGTVKIGRASRATSINGTRARRTLAVAPCHSVN